MSDVSDKTIVECMCAVMARRRVLPMIPLRNFTSLEEVADAFNSAARELDRLQADNARLRDAITTLTFNMRANGEALIGLASEMCASLDGAK